MKLAKALKRIGGLLITVGLLLALGEWQSDIVFHYVVAIGIAFIGWLCTCAGKEIERVAKIKI